jgi:hypothetical protein
MQLWPRLSRLRQEPQPSAMQPATAPSTTAGLMRPSYVRGWRLASPRTACCMLLPTSTSQRHSRTAAGALPSASAWLMCWCALQTTWPPTRPGATGAHPSQHCSSLTAHPLCHASHSRCRRAQTQRHTRCRLALVQPAQLLLSIDGGGARVLCAGGSVLWCGRVVSSKCGCVVGVAWAKSVSECGSERCSGLQERNWGSAHVPVSRLSVPVCWIAGVGHTCALCWQRLCVAAVCLAQCYKSIRLSCRSTCVPLLMCVAHPRVQPSLPGESCSLRANHQACVHLQPEPSDSQTLLGPLLDAYP